MITRRSFATREASKMRTQVIDALKTHPSFVRWLSAILLWRCDDPALPVRIAGSVTGLTQPSAIHSDFFAPMVEMALS
ncbi:hypothetical protein [Breoghania sp.]|uniref:hypothetical protein n=1 Tax=Breoghania sp. TaxID=2065378 RepID=UPI0026057387|nr:hypothetical protein [Breoghania sp.]MDJ0931849.1 hypothetical protein [Breoghania sp.]